MSFETWLLFAVTDAAISLVPGPAVLLMWSTGMSRGRGPGLRAASGILSANVLYFVLSASSLGAILLASRQLFVIIKWAGACYLLWLGLRMLVTTVGVGEGGADPQRVGGTGRNFWLQGLVTQAANPKALLFFAALLPQFVNPEQPLVPQISLLAVTSISVEFMVLAGYACLADGAARIAGRTGLTIMASRLGGGLLIAAAASLAAVSNHA